MTFLTIYLMTGMSLNLAVMMLPGYQLMPLDMQKAMLATCLLMWPLILIQGIKE